MQKLKLELTPGQGCLPIRLGILRQFSRIEMENIGLPPADSHGSLDYYHNNSIQIAFDDDDRSSFIGIATDKEIELLFRGHDLFKMPAREVFNIISKFETDNSVEFNEDGCIFPGQIITLWEADDQYDWYTDGTTETWGQIGVGSETYLKAISN
ncbi:MAG: hypothetical protein GY796_22055 [Chloroflexi bacterium]|nr:hypothetical protein [Chloroflexota bacterium]